MADQYSLIHGGCQLARAAAAPAVRAQVMAEHAAELAEARGWRRYRLSRRIEAEVRRRVAKIAPSDALY
jgi:hypothetical protein